ncbi:hypothetical protein OCU04_002892 [Sclerotinia nivalis]|uniref:Uncharacterized protein n=1 Tax=Sclerotinia nivalis TaxID=352851 RepID=A0A9X0DMN2_9HELO|nr:hypothetical protein OCU04_002892 [Sclerotinia nivalis]
MIVLNQKFGPFSFSFSFNNFGFCCFSLIPSMAFAALSNSLLRSLFFSFVFKTSSRVKDFFSFIPILFSDSALRNTPSAPCRGSSVLPRLIFASCEWWLRYNWAKC